ncbi:MAG: aldo/keto reductase [Sphingomonas sp.]|nr:aldo/keto reductase [Sphingomonas sp.]
MTPGTEIGSRTLGRMAIALPRLGIGCSNLGDRGRHMTQAETDLLVDAALGQNANYFDVAPYYGFGLAERRLGDALRRPGCGPAIVSTKVGRLLAPDAAVDTSQPRNGFHSSMPFRPEFDYSYDGVMRSHEASLQRLGLARIDILLVHDIGAFAHGPEHPRYLRQLFGGGFRALHELKRAGDIRAFGLGVNETAVCHEILNETELDCILLAGRYTLLEQQSLHLLDRCLKAGTSVIAGGPYNSGLLAGGTRRSGALRYDYGEAPQHILDRVRQIETLCDGYCVPIAAAALQFPLGHPAVASVLPGIGSAGRVAETVDLLNFPIPLEFWTDLRTRGLFSAATPPPTQECEGSHNRASPAWRSVKPNSGGEAE